jgi:hypothetical protein
MAHACTASIQPLDSCSLKLKSSYLRLLVVSLSRARDPDSGTSLSSTQPLYMLLKRGQPEPYPSKFILLQRLPSDSSPNSNWESSNKAYKRWQGKIAG